MIVFITGGSGCGKSAFAESVAVRLGGPRIYIATMPVFSEEDRKKVERHHKLRAGKGFQTLERPKLLSDIPGGEETVLIECMSTHTANMLFDPALSEERKGEDPFGLICRELDPILQRKGHTIFVSAEIAKDGCVYDPKTENYKRVLRDVNQYLAARADAAFEVVCGIPVCFKGELLC